MHLSKAQTEFQTPTSPQDFGTSVPVKQPDRMGDYTATHVDNI